MGTNTAGVQSAALGLGGGSSLDRNISALAPLAFTASDIALQASQAIAVLAASDYIDDSFVAGDGSTYSRVTHDEHKDTANIFKYPKVYPLANGNRLQVQADGILALLDSNHGFISYANPLIYQHASSDNLHKYLIQVDGSFVSIDVTKTITADGAKSIISYGASQSFLPILINSDEYTAFAEKNNITANTKLGATILLKTLLMDEGYPSTELDETFIDIQPDYIAFIEKTLTPGLDSELTAVSSGIKAAIDFLKKIIQKASQ